MPDYPDPRDPLVQEDIQDAVKRARDSALGSYMSEQDAINAAAGDLGAAANAPGMDIEIQREVRRQFPTGSPVQNWGDFHSSEERTPEPDVLGPEPVSGVRSSSVDPVFDVRVDHWCADDEIRALQGCAPFDNSLMQNRYEPTCPSEFYRGYLTPLVGLVQSVGVDDTVERYRWVANEIDETVKTWSGTSDQCSGAGFSMANAWEYSVSFASVAQILAFIRGEIACVAECFQIARVNGL